MGLIDLQPQTEICGKPEKCCDHGVDKVLSLQTGVQTVIDCSLSTGSTEGDDVFGASGTAEV